MGIDAQVKIGNQGDAHMIIRFCCFPEIGSVGMYNWSLGMIHAIGRDSNPGDKYQGNRPCGQSGPRPVSEEQTNDAGKSRCKHIQTDYVQIKR